MDIKEFIILKEGFFDSRSYAKFLKFVKNDLQYFDQGIINNRDKGDIKIDSNLRKVKGAHLNNNWAIAPNKDDTFAMTKILWYNFLVRQFSYLLKTPVDYHIRHGTQKDKNGKPITIVMTSLEMSNERYFDTKGLNIDMADPHPINQLEGSPQVEKNGRLPFIRLYLLCYSLYDIRYF